MGCSPKKAVRSSTVLAAMTAVLLMFAACDEASSVDEDATVSQSATVGSGGAGAATSSGAGAAGGAGGGAAMCGALTQWEQKMLDAHNRWRASVQPPAANMHRMYWDVVIAQNAAAWVSSCDTDWPHSSEELRTDLGGYDVLGENLSWCGGTGCTDDPNITDGSGMGDGEGWWAERNDYDWDNDSSTGGVVSHYTQMVSSNIYAIGCATQRCSAPGPSGWDGEWWWTICQYGPRGQGYWNGTKPYEAGDGMLIEPPDSVFDDHPGLCR